MFKKVRSGIIALAVLGAIAVGASAIAGAASNSGATGTTGAQGSSGSNSGNTARPDPATVSHGPGETLLTDGTLNQVKQAALGKVSGATVIRIETDSQGSPYEAHLRKSDGTEVTVKVDKQFQVTAVQDGFGGGPHP
jgi:uncharacterized membrane protein YkoI